jgi:hypothetical protein
VGNIRHRIRGKSYNLARIIDIETNARIVASERTEILNACAASPQIGIRRQASLAQRTLRCRVVGTARNLAGRIDIISEAATVTWQHANVRHSVSLSGGEACDENNETKSDESVCDIHAKFLLETNSD